MTQRETCRACGYMVGLLSSAKFGNIIRVGGRWVEFQGLWWKRKEMMFLHLSAVVRTVLYEATFPDTWGYTWRWEEDVSDSKTW